MLKIVLLQLKLSNNISSKMHTMTWPSLPYANTHTHTHTHTHAHTHARAHAHAHAHTTVSWPFVRDNPGNRYQKKQSPTHIYDEVEEGFALTTRSIVWEFMNPLDSALNQRGLLDPIKPAYNQKSGQMAGSH